MRLLAKRLLKSLRLAAGRFVLKEPPIQHVSQESTVFKAMLLMADCKIEGDYLEFGVFEGGSFAQAYHAAEQAVSIFTRTGAWHSSDDIRERLDIWSRMRFVAFDSFQGLPELSGIDRDSRVFRQGQFSCTEDQFLRLLDEKSVPRERVVLVPGWFAATCVPATAARLGLRKAAVVFIDCDLYESARCVLEFVTPLLQDGTVLIFDDWFHFAGSPYRGEQRAFREWSSRIAGYSFAEYQKEGFGRNSFIASVVKD